ncbi:MAG: prolipoprotein diacylglyceryl transferase [Deltaproteobacteria bacterium]|nr:prolipoprotein diacylglyceryl transferase [Deltaproteobacteria bacterium]
MKPILFKLGLLSFPSYTFLIMIGILIGTWLGLKICRQRGLPVIYGIDMAIIGIVAGFLGGRVAHVLVEAPAYYWEEPVRFFYFWQGGFVSWGAYIFVLASWYFYLTWRKQPVLAYFDAASMILPVLFFFGRTGCLLAGCCFGKPTDFLISLTFTDPGSTAYQYHPNIPLHATQVYLMLNVLFIQMVLWFVYKKRWRFQGQLLSILFLMYPVGRFLIEFLRGDIDRGVYFGGTLSAGQLAMIPFFLVGIYMYRHFKKLGVQPPPRIA